MESYAPMKKTKGRRKIEMKKIEKKPNRSVTFSKRRMGLFRKASELSVLCGTEIAILVQSPADKIYCFSSSSVDSVLQRYQGYESALINDNDEILKTISHSKIVYLDAESRLNKEKGIEKSELWWDRSDLEILSVQELEDHLKALEGLKSSVLERVEKLKLEPLPTFIDVNGVDDWGFDDLEYLKVEGPEEDELSNNSAVAVSTSSSVIDNAANWGTVSELTPMDSDILNYDCLTDLKEGDYGYDYDDLKGLFEGIVQEDNFAAAASGSCSSFRHDPNFGLFEDSSNWDDFVKST